MASLKEKFFQVGKTLDRQEQYSRRNYLLVHGVEEKNIEDTDQEISNIAKNDLGEEITIHDIDRTHRLIVMFHDLLLLDLQGTMFSMEFLKLKRNLKEKL